MTGDRLVADRRTRAAGAGVQYGLDAARVPIWFATACSRHARASPPPGGGTFSRSADAPAPLALTLDGGAINGAPRPFSSSQAPRLPRAAGDRSAARADARAQRSRSTTRPITATHGRHSHRR